MDVAKGNINSILNGFKQFIIPVYQRTYSWGNEQCQRLWDDIVAMQEGNLKGHFVGSIVNVAEQAMPTSIQKYMIIDGQQRMTTLTLLLLAVRDYGLDNPTDTTINARTINGMCIQNDYSIGDEKYKMILTKEDKKVLIKLIERSPLENSNSSRLVKTYIFFADKIAKGQLSPSQIIEGIAKLQIVNITLERTVDNPQLIFESLNSTGMDLSQSDLIRNYVLMGLENEQQQNIYINYWLLIEQLFDYANQTVLMDKFLRDYLTYKNGKIPVMNKVYEEFKRYHQNKVILTVEAFCKDILAHASHYTNMYYARSGDEKLDEIFSNIKDLQMDVAFPFLLKVYSDYTDKKIDRDSFCTILRLCESYVVRRAICGISTSSLNKTFMVAINAIDHVDYLNSVKAFFVLQDSYKLFPTDAMFVEALKVKDIYNMRIRNYILSKFENYDNKAYINIEKLTIEHIMPQNKNLSQEWKIALGNDWQEIQKTYLHTIGNLTLTAYNPNMSDSPFMEKMDMKGGFKQSALRINSFVISQNTWNKENIEERANELCKLAKTIWAYPTLPDTILVKYKPVESDFTEISIENYEYLNGALLDLYEEIDKQIRNISSDVKREFKKLYIAYKVGTNFVDIVPQKSRLRLSVNMKFTEVIDPKGICKDVTDLGRWGNGDVELHLSTVQQIDDIMAVIMQAYNKQIE